MKTWFIALLSTVSLRTKGSNKSFSMKIRPQVKQRHMKLARDIAEKHKGKLPTPWRLIPMGHESLYRYFVRHPELAGSFEYDDQPYIDSGEI